MAAYPNTQISRESEIDPNAGLLADLADDLTEKYRSDAAETIYEIRIVHDWITAAEFATLTGFIAANGFGVHTVTVHGRTFDITLLNEPRQMARSGDLFRVETFCRGTEQ